MVSWLSREAVIPAEQAFYPECETPSSKTEYEALAKRTLDLLMRLEIEEEGWEFIETGISPDEVKLLEKLDSNGLSCLKTVGKMPCPAKESSIETIQIFIFLAHGPTIGAFRISELRRDVSSSEMGF